jgi:tRNA A37 threonylcarbamoyladenosine biosynthesis protein TsaE
VTSPTFVLARTHPSLAGGAPLVHVDAYRLSNAVELDDLDIDFARSITVVEWGRGLVEPIVGSWLDVEIVRPQGAGAGAGVEDGERDADASPDETIVETRTVTISGHGPRWSE